MINNLLIYLKQQQFTGVLQVKAKKESNIIEWKVYLCLGKLIWADGGYHANRSWQRHLLKYCPNIDFTQIELSSSDKSQCPEYLILTTLLQRKLAQQELITQLIISRITEIFFDILQQEEIEPLSLEHQQVSVGSLLDYGLKMSIAMLEPESLLEKAKKEWLIWQQNGFSSYSPNAAPEIKNQQQLQQAVSPVIYQNFVRLLDGKKTLRDLGFDLNKDVFKLSASLFPYVQKGLIKLVNIQDIQIPNSTLSYSQSEKSVSYHQPLIACIDDSPQVCRIMEQIITKANYRFLGIQQPLQAVPTLISANPNLIFLDIGMPLLNGYELCSQIRRVSKLKEIPIIFLTGNDGIVDRVKAKVVGASDFIAKPVEVEKIIKTIDKFFNYQGATISVSC
jgi:CheY-like chemotaxis protein